MTASGNMPPPDTHDGSELLQLALPVSQKVVLVIDLVESVRLMAADEAGTVARWRDFAQTAQNHTIPAHHGRLVKSLGDGLMVEFETPRDAANAAHTLHAVMQKGNAVQSPERHMHLRAGINATHVYTDHNDIYGAGVNLAARIATLAGPGETVVTAQVRDGLTDGLDATVEDLGECYLKHIDEPVRAYRVGAAGQAPVVVAQREYATPLQPTIAVIPFTSRSNEPEHFAIGELIADGVIHQLGKTGAVRVVSRLSTTTLRNRNDAGLQAKAHLAAGYVLSGSYLNHNNHVIVFAELADSASQQIVWSERLQADAADLFQTESKIAHTISAAASLALISREVENSTHSPLPTLRSYSLMLGAVTLMHRATHADFLRARAMLDRLVSLHSRHGQPLAWLGKWYVLQVAQGWSVDPVRDANEALTYCQKALEYDSSSALAVAVTGQVHGYLKKDLAKAESMYRNAITLNPNEPLAWLWLGMTSAFRGDGNNAVSATEHALSLSPLDPLRYYYQSLAASASIANGQYDRAIELAKSSLRANRAHSSTYRALAIAQALSGRVPEAKTTISQLLTLEPKFTVNAFLSRYPGREEAKSYTDMLGNALAMAGLPP